MSSSTSDIEHGDVPVAVETSDAGMSENDADDNDTSPNVVPAAVRIDREKGDKTDATRGKHDGEEENEEEGAGAYQTTPGNDGGEQKEQEEGHGEEEEQEVQQQEEGHAQKARRGKRKLGGAAKPLRRYSVRAAGSRRPEDADSPTREPSKRQRKASEPGTGKQCGGGGSATVPKTSTPMIARRHGHRQRRSCQEHGCTTLPSFGNIGSKKAEYYSQHANEGMVNVVCKKCGHPGCMKWPSYGKTGSKKADFCKRHAKQGMVDDVSKKCGHPGCMKRPSFGEDGSKKADFCCQHARNGMVDVMHKRCGHPGCTTSPSFGMDGSNNRDFC
ncbi:unnamed protein product, partial [Ectocarpus sp. 8 AP-2014]